MPKFIQTNLWFNNQAEDAAKFYTSIFNHSEILTITRYGKVRHEIDGINEGTVMTVLFKLEDQEIVALNGGPQYTLNPSISFFVNCGTIDEVNNLWEKLSPGGFALMPLNQYPFSERFGWVMDKFGVNWQINLGPKEQKIMPFLMFTKEQHGKAKEAMNFYTSIFKNSSIEDKNNEVSSTIFTLNGQKFMAFDGGLSHDFTFTEAISFIVNCKTQAEIDYYWDMLSQGGNEKDQVCGWLKDHYGISWQIVPESLTKMITDPNQEKVNRVMKALLQMKKLDIETLNKAYND